MKFTQIIQDADRSSLEAWCRNHTQQCYLGDNVALARVLGGHLMYVDTRDLSLTPHMLMNGFWEMWVTQAICDYVKPGMRAIDVGANCGYFTVLLSELVGDKGFVQAYEPQPRLGELLRKTLDVNGFRQASVSAAAVAESSYAASTLYVNETHLGSAAISAGRHINEEPIPIATVSLDEDGFYVQGVDFVKIDVQGAEMRVLRGMKKTIARSPRIAIALEFTAIEHEDPASCLKEIEDMGLTLRAVGTDGLVRALARADAICPDTGDHRMLWLSKG